MQVREAQKILKKMTNLRKRFILLWTTLILFLSKTLKIIIIFKLSLLMKISQIITKTIVDKKSNRKILKNKMDLTIIIFNKIHQ